MPSILKKINIISRCAATYRVRSTKEFSHSIFHSYVLAICKNPGFSQDKLAKHLYLNKSSVARHLASLQKDGYIERRVSEEDKRESLVYPTQKMLSICPEISRINKEWNALVTEGITEEELEIFEKIIDKMVSRSIDIYYSEEAEK